MRRTYGLCVSFSYELCKWLKEVSRAECAAGKVQNAQLSRAPYPQRCDVQQQSGVMGVHWITIKVRRNILV